MSTFWPLHQRIILNYEPLNTKGMKIICIIEHMNKKWLLNWILYSLQMRTTPLLCKFYKLHEPNCLSTRISSEKKGMHSTQSSGLSFHMLRSFADSSINMNSEQQQANFGLQSLVKAVSSIKTNSRRREASNSAVNSIGP